MDEKVQIAFGVWAGVSLLGYVLFYANKNSQFQRKYYPAFSVVTGALFLFI
ncbi:putative membrane protein, partial [Vibrio vulnificus]